MLFGLDYRQTKVTDSTLQNTLAILKNKRIPLDPRAKSSDTLALLTNFRDDRNLKGSKNA